MFIDTIFPTKNVTYQPTSIHFPKQHRKSRNLSDPQLELAVCSLRTRAPYIQRAKVYRTKSRNLSHPQSELTASPHIRGHVMSAEPPHPPPILSSSSRLNLFASHMVSTGCTAPNYCPCQVGHVRSFRCDPWASVRVPSLLASIGFEMWLSWIIFNKSQGILLIAIISLGHMYLFVFYMMYELTALQKLDIERN